MPARFISGEEVVMMGLWKSSRDKESAVTEALAMTDALSLRKRLFHSLSGGERQRVKLAKDLDKKGNIYGYVPGAMKIERMEEVIELTLNAQ